MNSVEPENQSPILRKQLVAELLIVFGIAYFPSLYNAVRYLFGPFSTGEYFGLGYDAFRLFTVICLIFYLIWSGGESFKSFGITKLDPLDLLWAIPIALLAYGLNLGYDLIVPRTNLLLYGPSDMWPDWAFPHLHILIPYLFAIALIQELMLRSYLITRLSQIGWKSGYAVILSAVLYSSYHLRHGWIDPVFFFVIGLIFALYFVRFKRMWPLVIAHFCLNLLFYVGSYKMANVSFKF